MIRIFSYLSINLPLKQSNMYQHWNNPNQSLGIYNPKWSISIKFKITFKTVQLSFMWMVIPRKVKILCVCKWRLDLVLGILRRITILIVPGKVNIKLSFPKLKKVLILCFWRECKAHKSIVILCCNILWSLRLKWAKNRQKWLQLWVLKNRPHLKSKWPKIKLSILCFLTMERMPTSKSLRFLKNLVKF